MSKPASKRDHTQAEAAIAFTDAIDRLDSAQAQRLIERFHLVRSIADGGLIGAVLMPHPALTSPALAIAKPMSEDQFGRLHQLMGEGKFLSSVATAKRIRDHISWVTAIADGSVDNSLIVRERVRVIYNPSSGGRRSASLMLVSFGNGIDNVDKANAMLADYGLLPATVEQGAAFVSSHLSKMSHIEGVRTVSLPGTTYTSGDRIKYAMMRASRKDCDSWEFDHESGWPPGTDYCCGPSHGEWILAVQNERKLK